MDPKEVLAFLSRRRSVRRYQGKIIPEELLELVMKAAMAAPSGNNTQPWEFVIVRDKVLKEKISRVHPWVHMAAEAPAAIVVLGDKSSKWWEHDCAAAAENLLLAAANLGLGTVWCGITEEQAPAVRKLLNISERLGVLCIVPIGYPADPPSPHTKYRKDKVHKDRYGSPMGPDF
jgi:nitroreductase